MVKQGMKKELRWKARIQTELFGEILDRRVRDDSVKVAKGFEANFYAPQTPEEVRIKQSIDVYHARKTTEWEADVFKQKTRLAEAERKLSKKETKKALNERRIANYKVSWNLKRIAELKRTTPEPNDSRIFLFWYVPVLVAEGEEFVIKPMRYHCRPNGKPASIDKRYPGLYNARRDSLEQFWKGSFGTRHAVVILSSFYENVAQHRFEQRALRPGEKDATVILQYEPRPAAEMYVACIWDCWQSPGEPDLNSFAVITDDPPPEIAATGHDRCPIPLKAKNIESWLKPQGKSKDALYQLLDDRECPHYEHRLVA